MPVVLWWKTEKEGNEIDLVKSEKTYSFPFSIPMLWIDIAIRIFVNKKEAIATHCIEQKSKLNDDFTDYFGIQKKQIRWFKLIKKHQYYVYMYAITKSHIWTTRRLYIEIELEDYKPKGATDINEYEEFRNVSMSLDGAPMNPQTMSVFQYYSDRFMAIKKNKKAKQDAKRLKGKK
tara:strand:+ start:110 stop:637 length:528 start_codon:yes stop_codon:yes gene_type:complete